MSIFSQWRKPSGPASSTASADAIRPAPIERGEAARVAAERTARRVLVVEDDESLRHLVARNLTARGHAVTEAADAREALEALRNEAPEVLVLDINLPDATGWDILRSAHLGDQTAVVMLTAVPISPKRLGEFRPVAYLPKPFPLEALVRLVDRCGRYEDAVDDGES
jgi:DNA-binding response OmpR family regulator